MTNYIPSIPWRIVQRIPTMMVPSERFRFRPRTTSTRSGAVPDILRLYRIDAQKNTSAANDKVVPSCPPTAISFHFVQFLDENLVNWIDADKANPRVFVVENEVDRDTENDGEDNDLHPVATPGERHGITGEG